MKRRHFIQTVAASVAASVPFLSVAKEKERTEVGAAQSISDPHADLKAMGNLKMMGNEEIVMLLYPGFAALDLVGPQYIFASMMGAKVHLVAKDVSKPVKCGQGISITPTMSFDDVKKKPTIFFVPGAGMGMIDVLEDKETMDFVTECSTNADYVTSVCTGSLILAKTGLLEGRRATSHWTALNVLKDFGLEPVNERVVTDGNLITGGGITAGIDFGLTVLAALRGENYAKAVQLQMEYAPAPPFNSGTPETAPPGITKSMRAMNEPVIKKAREIARKS